MPRKQMTAEEFDQGLEEILSQMSGNQLLDIPGVYEAVSEHFNNEVIERWEEENK